MPEKGRSYFTLDQISRNQKIFLITGLDITVLITPVIVLVWLETGLNFDEMLLLQGIFVLPIILLEVPSGSIADYWSRKGCIVLFHLLFGSGMFFYAVGDSFIVFAFAELLAGMAISFKTGSETALIYDSLSVYSKYPNGIFGRLVANRMIITFAGNAFGAIIGGIIALFTQIRLPILITFLGHLTFSGIALYGYVEPPRVRARTPRAAISKACSSLLRKPYLQLILLVSLTGLVFARVGFWAFQHIFVNDYAINSFGMGIIMALLNISAALTSVFVRSRVTQLTSTIVLISLIIFEGLYLIALIQVQSVIGVLFVAILGQITRGSRTPIIQSIMQNNLTSDERATFNSIISLIGSTFYLIISWIVKFSSFSRSTTLLLSILGISILLSLFLVISLTRLPTKKECSIE